MADKTRTSTPSRGAGGTRRGNGRPRRKPGHAKSFAPNPFAALLPTVKADVTARLLGLLDAQLDAARPQGKEVVELVSAIRDLCARGGKRLRPALLVVGYRSASARAPLEVALDAGVALELLQAYFLIHDDWMDKDVVRRGGPAVHAQLSKRFRSDEKGAAAGVLAGDYAAALAALALSRSEIPAKRMPAVLSCFSQMQLDAVAGQQLDLIGRQSDLEATYALKTASYTVRGPLRMGALIAGAGPRVLETLDRFAEPAGIAFQLRDDLLSAFGDPAQTGKAKGRDLTSGKRTALFALAMAKAKGRDRQRLASVFGNPRAGQRALDDAISVLDRSGARAQLERRIEELLGSALSALQTGHLTLEGRVLLEGAARALTARRG